MPGLGNLSRTLPLFDGGRTVFGSVSGTSGHYCNPFFALSDPNTGEHSGEIYGFNLIYSGSYAASVEADSYGSLRIMAGVQSEGFHWTLAPGESFLTPEAVLTFSIEGRNGLRHNMHRFVTSHILPSHWREKPRPILVNNWEATYFDFTPRKLLSLAAKAAGLGAEHLCWMMDGLDAEPMIQGDWVTLIQI